MKKSTRLGTGGSMEVDWTVVVSVGIDLGDRTSRYIGLDGAGERVAEGRLPTTAEAFEKRSDRR
jgi:hypothetical protein